MCAVPSAPGVAGVRVGRLCHGNRGHDWGDRRRRALILASTSSLLSRIRRGAAGWKRKIGTAEEATQNCRIAAGAADHCTGHLTSG